MKKCNVSDFVNLNDPYLQRLLQDPVERLEFEATIDWILWEEDPDSKDSLHELFNDTPVVYKTSDEKVNCSDLHGKGFIDLRLWLEI